MIYTSIETEAYKVFKINDIRMNAKTGDDEMRRKAGCVKPLCRSSGGHKQGVANTAITIDFPRQQLQYFKTCISYSFLLKKKARDLKKFFVHLISLWKQMTSKNVGR